MSGSAESGSAAGEAADAAELLDRLAGEHRELVLLLDRLSLLRRISQRARDAGGLDIGMIGEPHGSAEIVLRGHAGTLGDGLRELVVPSGFGLGGKVAASGRPDRVDDYLRSSAITHHFDQHVAEEQLGAVIGVPMSFAGHFGGVLYTGLRRSERFGDDTIDAVWRAAEVGAEQLYVADRLRQQTEAAVTAERSRIAEDLHDSVGAMLFTVGAQLRDLRSDPDASPVLLGRLGEVESRIADTAATLRGSIAALRETEPRQRLTAALTEDCRRFRERTGVLARCVTVTDVPALPAETGAAVLSSAREAMLNVEKHARACSVVLSVAALDSGVSLAVADDGLGWRAESTNGECGPFPGVGLRSAADRLERLGGSLSVVENEDGGLTVRMWVPSPDGVEGS